MARVIVMNIKKMLMIILITVVSILVIMAFYSNMDKFGGLETAKYIKIAITSPVSASELAERYSDSKSKDRFVAELKKINGITSTNTIDKSTVLIPVFDSN